MPPLLNNWFLVNIFDWWIYNQMCSNTQNKYNNSTIGKYISINGIYNKSTQTKCNDFIRINVMLATVLKISAHKKVMAIDLPLILSNLTAPLLGLVDTAVIGHLGEAKFLASITAGAWIFSFLYGNFIFLRMGTTGLAAQSFGSKNYDELVNIVVRSLIIGLCFGILILLIRDSIMPLVNPLLNLSDEVSEHASLYISIRALSAPAALMNFGVTGWLIAMQKTKVVLFLAFVVNGLNAILDVIFVNVFDMGVSGVATGTLISEWIACLIGLAVVFSTIKKINSEITLSSIFNKSSFGLLFNINVDIFLRTLCLTLSHLWFINRSSTIGDLQLAVNGVLLNFHVFAAFFIDGFAFTAETLVGESKGARDFKMFREYVITSSFWCLLVGAFCSLIFLGLGSNIVELLTDIDAVNQHSGPYLIWVVVLPVIAAVSYQLDGIFLGATQTSAMRNGMFISLLVLVGTSFYLVSNFGNHGLWGSFVLFMLARCITLGLKYRNLENTIVGD